jgi:hypothetical protein
MVRPLRIFLAALVCLLVTAGTARAAGGSYVFDGGTPSQREQVHAALEASAFDWSRVPGTVTIHIARGIESKALPGEIWLDGDLLDAGRFSWGVVQHEYAHQVDFLLLASGAREELAAVLGGSDWCDSARSVPHSAHGCERFASTLAWAYWQVGENCMRPESPNDEAAAMAPAAFRKLLTRLIGVPDRISQLRRGSEMR